MISFRWQQVAQSLLVFATTSTLFLAGCGGVQMSPRYAQSLEQSEITVGELNTRCQAGDDLACKGGLRVATEALNLLVDALHGKGAADGE